MPSWGEVKNGAGEEWEKDYIPPFPGSKTYLWRQDQCLVEVCYGVMLGD